LRQLRAFARRQAQELDILKKAIAIFSVTDNL
jgi:transposase